MSGELLARVRPMIGEALQDCRVLVAGTSQARPLVEYLAACGVRHWQMVAGNEWLGALVGEIRARYGNLLDIATEVAALDTGVAIDLALVVDDAEMARRLPVTVTRLAVFTPRAGAPCRGVLALPGEMLELDAAPIHGESVGWGWQTAAPLLALLARALLLRGGEYAMPAWQAAWAQGQRLYCVGGGSDPTVAAWYRRLDEVVMSLPSYSTPPARRGTLLVAGVGSLGSVAAQALAPWVERLVLVDPDHVEVTNLVRQAYSHAQIGQAKAVALAQTLGAAHPHLVCEAVVARLEDEAQVAALLDAYGVTAALVTTGTHADFAIARALWARGVPHVVGRCYARARFWEGIVVDGISGPSYETVRRGVALGPTPMPTPEEVAAYGAVGELVAEPATAMETGWSAHWLARLAQQMLLPPALREGWLLARLAAGAFCFVGGVVVEAGEAGAAYAIDVPGKVHAWSMDAIDG